MSATKLFLVGAAKCGTTTIHTVLASHPSISMSSVKEPNFFSGQNYHKGFQWYNSLFDHKKCVLGESSTYYTRLPLSRGTATRLYQYAPLSKILYLVRDPIDRLISHYIDLVANAMERQTLSEIMKTIDNHPEHLLQIGDYTEQLAPYEELFSPEQILVIQLEALKTNHSLINKILDFLGVAHFPNSHEHVPKLNMSSNKKGQTVLGRLLTPEPIRREILQRKYIPWRLGRFLLAASRLGGHAIATPLLSEREINQLCCYYSGAVARLADRYPIELNLWRDYDRN